MSALQYFKSKTFLKQLGLAVIIFILVVFLFMNLLSFITNHGQEIMVPDVTNLTVEEATEKLEDMDLELVVLDTLDYNPDFSPLSLVLQDPKPGFKVKKSRRVYVKLNSEGFASVELPELTQKTIRQVESLVRVKGLQIGTITYKPDLGKDMVLEVSMNGKPLKAGDKIMKTSVIDLVLGDGKIAFDDSEMEEFFNEGENNEF